MPEEGIAQGSVFGYGDPSFAMEDSWKKVAGSFSLSTSGDSVIVYCLQDDEIHHLGGFVFGEWKKDDGPTSEYTSSESALPEALKEQGAVESRSGFDNFVYIGTRKGTKGEFLEALNDIRKWKDSVWDEPSMLDALKGGFEVVPDDTCIARSPDNNSSASRAKHNWIHVWVLSMAILGFNAV